MKLNVRKFDRTNRTNRILHLTLLFSVLLIDILGHEIEEIKWNF